MENRIYELYCFKAVQRAQCGGWRVGLCMKIKFHDQGWECQSEFSVLFNHLATSNCVTDNESNHISVHYGYF
jgi:hypothetical protein